MVLEVTGIVVVTADGRTEATTFGTAVSTSAARPEPPEVAELATDPPALVSAEAVAATDVATDARRWMGIQ
jgi:hypothetical protein